MATTHSGNEPDPDDMSTFPVDRDERSKPSDLSKDDAEPLGDFA